MNLARLLRIGTSVTLSAVGAIAQQFKVQYGLLASFQTFRSVHAHQAVRLRPLCNFTPIILLAVATTL